MVKIYKNGYVSPRTWSFVSKLTMTNYDMKIQMGWGDTMFKRLRCGAFLLAEQLVALTILGVVVASLVAVTEQVGVKRRQLEQNLVASRLVKEATDQIALGKDQVALSRQGVRAQATRQGARAFIGNKTLVEIKGNEHATAGLYNGRSNRSLSIGGVGGEPVWPGNGWVWPFNQGRRFRTNQLVLVYQRARIQGSSVSASGGRQKRG
ncbi:type II secretion system protein [Limosilactobacillus fermentum]|nr:type II secretion system protein [Limosilactobacillus fermentum]